MASGKDTLKGRHMTPSQIVSALHTLLDIRQPVFLWGAPGVGKSQIAAQVARAKDMLVIGLTGKDGGKLKDLASLCLLAPATETYQVQEYHLPMYHALCLAIEEEFFGEG